MISHIVFVFFLSELPHISLDHPFDSFFENYYGGKKQAFINDFESQFTGLKIVKLYEGSVVADLEKKVTLLTKKSDLYFMSKECSVYMEHDVHTRHLCSIFFLDEYIYYPVGYLVHSKFQTNAECQTTIQGSHYTKDFVS